MAPRKKKDFILMMPEGFEINGVDVPSVQVSIGSRYQRDISMYAFVRDVLRNRCRDLGAALLYQEVIDEYERCALNFEGVKSIKINDNILRSETAALSTISIISYILNL